VKTIYQIQSLSPKGQAWIKENGGEHLSLCAEQFCIANLIESMAYCGLAVGEDFEILEWRR
jgi:hypothetical protein